jgi:hypothetical protein
MKLASKLALGLGVVAMAAGAVQATTYVDDFTGAANPTGWAWNGFGGTTPTTGGNPGEYIRDNEFFTMPVVHTAAGTPSPFHGDYRAAAVSNISFDTRTFSNQQNTAWTEVGDLTNPRVGWTHTSVTIPSQAVSLPGGWVGDSFGDPFDWNYLITHVDHVALQYFNPDWFGIGAQFDVGMDNASITYVPEPAGLALLALGGLALKRRR